MMEGEELLKVKFKSEEININTESASTVVCLRSKEVSAAFLNEFKI